MEESLCLFRLPDGTIICTSCDHPPESSTYLRVAPEGTPEGVYQEPIKGDGEIVPENQSQMAEGLTTSNAATVLTVQCAHKGCKRSCFAIEQTSQGLAIVIKRMHDGEEHVSKYRYDFIKNVLTEEKVC